VAGAELHEAVALEALVGEPGVARELLRERPLGGGDLEERLPVEFLRILRRVAATKIDHLSLARSSQGK